MMERQLTQLVRIVDDLLDISRITRDKLELRRERIDLATVVQSAVETSRPLIQEQGHQLQVQLPGEPIWLDADLTRLAQVFANLLNNSVKYTPRGGHIRLEARREGEQVVAAVHDTGIGIPRESLKRIFDMFSQVDRTLEKTTGGLGIGLALVKGLVEMHDGSIEADSEGPNKGSTFTVRLPVAAPPAPVAASTVDAKSSAKRRILVVDDNQDSADSLAMLLRMLGNEVRTANDGLAALTVAEAFRPEVILMDVGMPKLNGLEATRQLRQQPWGTEPIVIMLTGWGQPEDRERSSAAGCDGHLVKPVDLTSLDSLLAKFRKARVGS